MDELISFFLVKTISQVEQKRSIFLLKGYSNQSQFVTDHNKFPHCYRSLFFSW